MKGTLFLAGYAGPLLALLVACGSSNPIIATLPMMERTTVPVLNEDRSISVDRLGSYR